MPPGFRTVAISEGAPFAAIADDKRQFYATQFHLEVAHTPDGGRLLKNFVIDICGCRGDWTMASFRDEAIHRIKREVGFERVICGLSGGVDSAVTAVLIHEAIGDQLDCIFVDHGLLQARGGRRGRRDCSASPTTSRSATWMPRSFSSTRWRGVSDPETKRKTIGRLFIEVFEEEAGRAGGAAFLAQGTLYPDVIESVSSTGGPSVTIKSHHNVGGLPERMKMRLIEPLARAVQGRGQGPGPRAWPARTFRRPPSVSGTRARHPHSGRSRPGARLEILRKADAIYLDEIRKAGLYDAIWQAFAVLLPVQTVGVMGDGRTYDSALALRAVTSTDGMTAESFPFDHAFLAACGTRIINEVPGINRVVYDVTSKPPGTIEWE